MQQKRSKMSLTPKQEKFAQYVATGITQSDAYRASYSVGEDTLPETVNNLAYKLMQNSDIRARVEEIRKPIVEKAQITLQAHLEELQQLRELAKESKQLNAAISAEVARGRASGLYVEKNEIVGELNVTKIVRTVVKPSDKSE